MQEEKIADCEFTVVQESEIPKELVQLIEERKEEPFKLSYGEEGYLYIVEGYGKQTGGGYSITVEQLYETKEQICISTSLIGPEEVKENGVETFPYIVVKLPYLDKDITFL